VVLDIVVDSAWQELSNCSPLAPNSRSRINKQRIFSCKSVDVGVELMDPPIADLLLRPPGQVDSKPHPRHFHTVSTTLDHKIVLLLSPRLRIFLGAIGFGPLGYGLLFAWAI